MQIGSHKILAQVNDRYVRVNLVLIHHYLYSKEELLAELVDAEAIGESRLYLIESNVFTATAIICQK